MEGRHVSCNVKGGLGNQLFQIFATLAYAIRTKRQARFYFIDKIGNRSSYWHSFFKGLSRLSINRDDFLYLFHYSGTTKIHHEPHYAYSEIPEYSEYENVLLDGYYQSRSYFQDAEKEIVQLLWGENPEFLGRKGGGGTGCVPKVGMHFRIGDYKNIQQCHPVMTTGYYVNALETCLREHGFYLEPFTWKEAVEKASKTGEDKTWRKLVDVLYLCEDADLSLVENHLTILREKYPYVHFQRGVVELCLEKGEKDCDRDWKEMALLSGCDWFVIPNSTFSWWSATFSALVDDSGAVERGEHWVYYPSVWFGPSLSPSHDVSDLLNQKGWREVSI